MDSHYFTFIICGLGWLSKSSLCAPTSPPTVRQSDSPTASVQQSGRKKAQNVQPPKTSGPWNCSTSRPFPLYSFFSLPQSASLAFSLRFLRLSPLFPLSLSYRLSDLVLSLPSSSRLRPSFFVCVCVCPPLTRQPAISQCGSTWLFCPITTVTSVHLLAQLSPTPQWRTRCSADLLQDLKNGTCRLLLGKFQSYQGIGHISIRGLFLLLVLPSAGDWAWRGDTVLCL